jgi:hypothetical protein
MTKRYGIYADMRKRRRHGTGGQEAEDKKQFLPKRFMKNSLIGLFYMLN